MIHPTNRGGGKPWQIFIEFIFILFNAVFSDRKRTFEDLNVSEGVYKNAVNFQL